MMVGGVPSRPGRRSLTLMAQEATGFVESLNWETRDLTETRDYAIVTDEPGEVAEMSAAFEADWSRQAFTPRAGSALIWCPDNGRQRVAAFIDGAEHTLWVQKADGTFEAQPADFTVVAGSTPQSTSMGTLFAHPLQVNVKDIYANPLAGVLVVFTPPISGASAVLSSPMAITNAGGNASVDARANAIMGGPYDVTASITIGTVTFSLTNTLAKLYLPLTIR